MHSGGKTMNIDNQRLKDIQAFKGFYGKKMRKADTIEEALEYETRIKELETEETEILERNGVKL